MKDQIFLKDYRKSIEIGAFQEERQITQDILVNICVHLTQQERADDAAVDDILSYDVLVNAVEENLAAHRYDLLESLAEDIAAQILTEPRAFEVDIEIQKLSRIDGALGVRIKRQGTGQPLSQIHATHHLYVIAGATNAPKPNPKQSEIFLPLIDFAPITNPIDQHILILKLDQIAWEISRQIALPVIDNQTETEAFLRQNRSFIRAYGKQIFAAPNISENFNPAKLTSWAKSQFNPISTKHIT